MTNVYNSFSDMKPPSGSSFTTPNNTSSRAKILASHEGMAISSAIIAPLTGVCVFALSFFATHGFQNWDMARIAIVASSDIAISGLLGGTCLVIAGMIEFQRQSHLRQIRQKLANGTELMNPIN